MNTRKVLKVIGKILFLVIIIAILVIAYLIYSKYNFNEYVKAEYNRGLSEFERDSKVKYSEVNSYKIHSEQYNDAMFYKEIPVSPNTSYRVTCMVKTENVENEESNVDAGAHICLNKTMEKSVDVTGTTDWTKLEFVFNSKDKTMVEVGFRLGGYAGNSKGTAWFSDFKIESGSADISNTWNFLCLLFDNVNVNIPYDSGEKNIKLHLSEEDKEDMKACIERFKTSLSELSKGKINARYEVKEVKEEITTMSHDKDNGYYVSPTDVKETLDKYIDAGKYDHIFIAFRTGDINTQNEIPVNDWIGLGGMQYRGIGFSNIRLPNESNNYIYKYDTRINTFPEEVYIHEFLHTLERNSEEYGYDVPELHSYSYYGYQDQKLVGLKDWYKDYLNCEIRSSSGNVGLNEEIFTKKPAKASDFNLSIELNDLKEPANIFEEIGILFKKLIKMFSNGSSQNIENQNELVESDIGA